MLDRGEIPGDVRPVRASVLSHQARFYWGRQPELARSQYQEAWKIYKDADDLKLELMGHKYGLELARHHFLFGRHKEANDIVAEIKEIGEPNELRKSLAECLLLEGWMRAVQKDYPAAELSFRNALQHAQKCYPDGHVMLLWCHFHLGQALRRQHRLGDAHAHYQYVEKFTRPHIDKNPDAETLWGHAFSRLYSEADPDEGTLDEVFVVADKGRKMAADFQQPQFYLAMAIARRQQGELEEAVDLLDRGLAAWYRDFPSLFDGPRQVTTSTQELKETLARYKQEQAAQQELRPSSPVSDEAPNKKADQVD